MSPCSRLMVPGTVFSDDVGPVSSPGFILAIRPNPRVATAPAGVANRPGRRHRGPATFAGEDRHDRTAHTHRGEAGAGSPPDCCSLSPSPARPPPIIASRPETLRTPRRDRPARSLGKRPSRSRNRSPTRSPSCGRRKPDSPHDGAGRPHARPGRPAGRAVSDRRARSDDPGTALGSLAFTLRAIGDLRAVPALIRALPRRLSTMTAIMDSAVQPRTARVPAKARHQPGARTGSSRSAPPIMRSPALARADGQRFPIEEQLHFVGFQGSPRQAGSRAASSTSSPRNGPSGGRRTGDD